MCLLKRKNVDVAKYIGQLYVSFTMRTKPYRSFVTVSKIIKLHTNSKVTD